MEHRHINFTGEYTPGIVDDIIARGGMPEWRRLANDAKNNPETRETIIRIVEHYKDDPYAQRQSAWKNYIEFMEENYPIEQNDQEKNNLKI